MSEQVLDLQTVLSVLRRQRRVLVLMTLLGAVAGVAVVRVDPPEYVSSAQVLLPPAPDNQNGLGRDTETDVRVALSDVVLGPAGRAVSPQLDLTEVQSRVTVSAPTSNVLQFEARSSRASQARALVGAAAAAEVQYLQMAASSLSVAQQSVLKDRTETLREQLDTVGREIETTRNRMETEKSSSARWHNDATAVARLVAQQTQLHLQVESLEEQSTPSQTGGDAQLIEAPTPAKRSDLVLWYSMGGLIGALLFLLLSALVVIAFSRRDRRLRTRDEIADAVGSAVIGSVHTRPQRAAAGWVALMETYEPSVTDAWSLRQALDHVGLGNLTVRGDGQKRGGGGRGRAATRTRVLTLITLSDDGRGLAVGPQLASHAATLGVRTRLVAGQGHASSTALWAACSSLRRDDEVRPGLHVDSRRRRAGTDDLVVELVVVDRRNPQFVRMDSHAVTLLAVSSSSATPEDLARIAVAAYEAGGRISGVILADPDTLDRTTGRLLLQQRSEQVPLPTRMTGVSNNDLQGPSDEESAR
jgi:capsular polysaccharide biosynthesis protein